MKKVTVSFNKNNNCKILKDLKIAVPVLCILRLSTYRGNQRILLAFPETQLMQ